MVRTMTKKEYAAKYAGRRGSHRFQIFHTEDGKDVVDFEFWAASRKDAEEELDLYRKKQELVSPVEREYFYKMADVHVHANKDGTVTVADSLYELMMGGGEENGRWRRALDRITSYLYAVENFARDFKYMLKDVAFWLGHYDRKSCHGEERADCWDVASMVQRKLLFNIPRLAKNLHGCPQPYVNQAVDAIREAKGLPPAAESDYCRAGDDALAEGMKLWRAELDRLVLYIRLFQYYDGCGTVDGAEMEKIDAEYRKTLPVHPGTDGEIDYAECAKLADKYWGLYCDLWKKIGRMCWD